MMITDSRLPKSKRYIRKAFLELLGEMPFQEITVKNIADRSELGRATFYLHYKDKADLLDEIETSLIEGLISLVKRVQAEGTQQLLTHIAESYHPGFAEYFRYIRKNSEELKVLFTPENGTDFSERFSRDLQEFHLQTYVWMESDNSKATSPIDMVLRLGASNFVNFFKIWLECDMSVSEEAMSSLLTNMWKGYIAMGEYAAPSSFYGDMARTLRILETKKLP